MRYFDIMDIIKWKTINAGSDDTRIIRHRLNRSCGIKSHSHDFPEFFWVVAGEGMHLVNGEHILLKTGDLIFMRAGDWHSLSTDSKNIFELINIAFPCEILQKLQTRYNDISEVWKLSPDMPKMYSLTELQRQWLEAAASNLLSYRDSRIELDRLLINLVCEIRQTENDIFQTCPEWLAKACRSSQQPKNFIIGSGVIAKIAGRTPEHTARTLLKCTGLTPSEVINRFRMDYAAAQLCTTDKNITEISDECGFGSLSYFFQRFRERFNISPRQYRLEQLRIVPRNKLSAVSS
jgi:AraC family transcriptional regulator, dual regulator of chb operon